MLHFRSVRRQQRTLLERIGQANTFMHIQTELGHTPTVESIKHVLESLELEHFL